jgi:hypothetical protein
MSKQDAKFWEKAVNARHALAQQHGADPNVCHIDLGYAPEGCQNRDQVVLRVHVTEHWFAANPEERTAFQREVDGIPICVAK